MKNELIFYFDTHTHILPFFSVVFTSINPTQTVSFSTSCNIFLIQNPKLIEVGVITIESEFSVAIPAAKLFKIWALETDTLLPKILPQAIKSSEIIEGNGGPGTIRKIIFPEGKPLTYMKQKVEALDEGNLTYTFSLIEANVWKNGIEKVTYERKFEVTPDGGSICKRTGKYYTTGDVDFDEDEIKDGNKMTAGLFKAIEAYYLANPDA